jgi:hypothetical protein
MLNKLIVRGGTENDRNLIAQAFRFGEQNGKSENLVCIACGEKPILCHKCSQEICENAQEDVEDKMIADFKKFLVNRFYGNMAINYDNMMKEFEKLESSNSDEITKEEEFKSMVREELVEAEREYQER